MKLSFLSRMMLHRRYCFLVSMVMMVVPLVKSRTRVETTVGKDCFALPCHYHMCLFYHSQFCRYRMYVHFCVSSRYPGCSRNHRHLDYCGDLSLSADHRTHANRSSRDSKRGEWGYLQGNAMARYTGYHRRTSGDRHARGRGDAWRE